MSDPTQYNDHLALSLEGQEQNLGNYQAQVFRGWFTPPSTTNYRFHMTCDDNCDLHFANTTNNVTTTELLNDISYAYFRRAAYTTRYSDTRISNWTALTAGGKYYIEVEHKQHTGGNHISVGVEIEQATLNATHPNNVKELQKLSYSQSDVRETHYINITNFSGDTG
jgi:hypothetical protein